MLSREQERQAQSPCDPAHPSATIDRSISPRRGAFPRGPESTYMPLRNSFRSALRLAALAALLATGHAHADDYTEVNQLLRNGKSTQALARADAYLAKNARDPQMRFLKAVALTDSGKTPR